ncbi:hypothetical protein HpVH77_13850 [Helicobacter pylori]
MSASFYDKNSSLYNKSSKDTYKKIKHKTLKTLNKTQTPKTNQQHLSQTLNIKNKIKKQD